jgi:hypothetical protein
MRDLRAVSYNRKPSEWAKVDRIVPASWIPEDLPRYDAEAIGVGASPLDDFAAWFQLATPAPMIFVVKAAEGDFLVNTEGYTYARYAARIEA